LRFHAQAAGGNTKKPISALSRRPWGGFGRQWIEALNFLHSVFNDAFRVWRLCAGPGAALIDQRILFVLIDPTI
jgi:hypothetical protein